MHTKQAEITRKREGIRKYAKNFAWLASDKVARLISNIVIGALVVRHLGPETFGILSAALAIIAFAEPLAGLGLNGITEKELLNNPNKQRHIIRSIQLAKLTAGIILSLFILAYALHLPQTDPLSTILLAALGKLLFHSHSTYENFFNARTRSDIIVKGRLILLIITEGAKLACVLASLSVTYFAAITSIQSLLLLVTGYYLFRKSSIAYADTKGATQQTIARLLKSSWPLVLSGFAYMIYLKIDIIMLKFMISDSASGIYSSAARLSESWYFIGVAISSSLFPAIIKAKRENPAVYEQRMALLSTLLFYISATSAFILFLLSPAIISILYGDEFASASHILRLHAFAGIFVFLGFAVSKWLIVEEQTIHSLTRHALGAISNVAMNFFLIPHYGGTGAAIATIFSYAISNLLFTFAFRSTRSLGFLLLRSMLANPKQLFLFIREKEN